MSTSIPTSSAITSEIEQGDRWQPSPIIEELKPKARAAGSVESVPAGERTRRRPHQSGIRAAVRDHGPLAHGAEVFNCSAPDTGNMEVLARYGTPEQKERWLKPLLAGEIRSCFCDDGAGGGVVRCHQYRGQHRARRR